MGNAADLSLDFECAFLVVLTETMVMGTIKKEIYQHVDVGIVERLEMTTNWTIINP